MDIKSAIDAVTVVATISGTEVVKEITKDGYKRFKDLLGSVFGRGATCAIEQIECNPTSDDARKELETVISVPAGMDEPELQGALATLLMLLRDEPAARQAAANAQISLDVESGGHVTVERLEGAKRVEVKSRSAGNFDFRDVRMDTGRDPGN